MRARAAPRAPRIRGVWLDSVRVWSVTSPPLATDARPRSVLRQRRRWIGEHASERSKCPVVKLSSRLYVGKSTGWSVQRSTAAARTSSCAGMTSARGALMHGPSRRRRDRGRLDGPCGACGAMGRKVCGRPQRVAQARRALGEACRGPADARGALAEGRRGLSRGSRGLSRGSGGAGTSPSGSRRRLSGSVTRLAGSGMGLAGSGTRLAGSGTRLAGSGTSPVERWRGPIGSGKRPAGSWWRPTGSVKRPVERW